MKNGSLGRSLIVNRSSLPRYDYPRNLVRFRYLLHTRFTYHRTWETGLETGIRVAAYNPAFFCYNLNHPDHSPGNPRSAPRIE
jgi:hypothetical protein